MDDTEASAHGAGDAESTRSGSRGRGRRAGQGLLYAIPTLGVVLAGWAHRNLAEDAFIYLRVVKQLEAGHGPVFNIGQRVEAYTGTIWLFVLSLADAVTPARLEWIAVTLGIACTGAGVLLAMLGARRLWSPGGDRPAPWFVPAGALVFVALLPVWVYASDGLENGLAYLWLGLCLWILARWASEPGRRLSLGAAAVLGLGWLVRPELVVYSALFFGLVLWREPSNRARLRIALAMLALPVAYQVFRMGYFGSLIPNTAIAKEGGSTNWSRGSRYLRDFAGPYWLWVPALLLIVGAYVPLLRATRIRTRRGALVGVFVIGALLEATYVAAVGGDYLHARLLLPCLFAFTAPVAVVPLTRRTAAALLVVPWAVVAMFWLKPDQLRNGNYLAHGFEMTLPGSYGSVTTDQSGWGHGGIARRWYRGPGYYNTVHFIARVRVNGVPLKQDLPLPYGAFWGVGVSGYAMGSNFHVLDLLGLADPLPAHLETVHDGVPRFAGHEKPLPAPWVAALVTRPGSRVDVRDFPDIEKPLIPATTGLAFQRQVAWARAALRCGGLARVLAAADAPLTPRRFLSNVVHSFANTRTRVPPDPEQAYHRFCGAGMPAEVRALDR